MDDGRSNRIKATHLDRKAAIYVRHRSTLQAASQRDQVRHARNWGWNDDAIDVVEDLSLSGSTSAERPGYQQLVDEIDHNLVGALFVSDLSRLNRKEIETFSLIDRLKKYDVLLVVDGRVINFADSRGLMAQITELFAEHDNRSRREAIQRGLIAKARAAARAAVEKVFRTFQKEPTSRHGEISERDRVLIPNDGAGHTVDSTWRRGE